MPLLRENNKFWTLYEVYSPAAHPEKVPYFRHYFFHPKEIWTKPSPISFGLKRFFKIPPWPLDYYTLYIDIPEYFKKAHWLLRIHAIHNAKFHQNFTYTTYKKSEGRFFLTTCPKMGKVGKRRHKLVLSECKRLFLGFMYSRYP